MNDELYTKCDSCGLPILHRTAKRNAGLCAHCHNAVKRSKEPARQNPPEKADPFDTDPELNWLKEIVDAAALEDALEDLNNFNASRGHRPVTVGDLPIMGFVHVFERHKKRILKDQYDIDWKTRRELNPYIWYD